MTSPRNIRSWLGFALVGAGISVIGGVVFNMTVAEFRAAEEQQAAAEVVPLVVPEAEVGSSGLSVGDVFAKLYVPRFGEGYVRNIAEGTSVAKVLNTVGIGHYQSTQMPGEIGNFAIAGHRAGNGGPMRQIDQLVPGDFAYVETSTTRYTYRFIESKIVTPDRVGVIKPMPDGLNGAVATAKYLTMTTCTPIYINSERYVAWFEQIDEQPIR